MEWPTDMDSTYHVCLDGDLFCRYRSEKEAVEGALDVKQRLPTSRVTIHNARTGYEIEVPAE